ncbi:alpha/beta fold hydrolase [Cytophagaceae bacterium ABcell3]|nr:alpha/beta fold hydrolase [Cytophagaceae bacterium ABcell3]
MKALPLILLLSILIQSHLGFCTVDGSNVVKEHEFLVSYEKKGDVSKAELQERNRKLATVALHDIQAYKIVYNTINTDGSPITASGLLLLPVADKVLPLLSLQHGTITEETRAPSYFRANNEIYTTGAVFASSGFAVSVPDYIGYGASSNLPHPYEHAQSLATAGRDMLRAVKEFCQSKEIPLSEQLFISGYSEGGYASMALMKLLEEKHADEFNIAACAPGGGAYDKVGFARYILAKDRSLKFINSYLWVLDTYNRVYGLDRPVSAFLKEPYATTVEKSGVHATVETNPSKLFTTAFKTGVLNDTDQELLKTISDNNIYDWKPKAPLKLFHGTDDDYVPFFNAQHAYDAMKARGASKVWLQPIEKGDHFSSSQSYVKGVFEFFSRYVE